MKAQAVGFDSLWLYDRLLYRAPNQPTEGIWEARTILSALAGATTRVELGRGAVHGIPHPHRARQDGRHTR